MTPEELAVINSHLQTILNSDQISRLTQNMSCLTCAVAGHALTHLPHCSAAFNKIQHYRSSVLDTNDNIRKFLANMDLTKLNTRNISEIIMYTSIIDIARVHYQLVITLHETCTSKEINAYDGKTLEQRIAMRDSWLTRSDIKFTYCGYIATADKFKMDHVTEDEAAKLIAQWNVIEQFPYCHVDDLRNHLLFKLIYNLIYMPHNIFDKIPHSILRLNLVRKHD
jgi:hypothetical protein